MRQLLRRAWYAFRRRQFEADLAEELDFHRELKQREIEGLGAGPTEASFAARRALGSIAPAQDLSRDVWCPRWLQGIGQDMPGVGVTPPEFFGMALGARPAV